MANLLNPDLSHERGTLRTLLLAALVLVLLAGAAFAIFYHHENHADAEVTSLRTLVLPLHTVYTTTGRVVGNTPATEDTTYVVTAVRVEDRADVPLFIKDISAGLVLEDGTPVEATRIQSKDMDRLLQIVPTLMPLLRQIGVAALQPEQTVAPSAASEGYVVLQISGPQSLWANRKSATLTLDFYHQGPVTVAIPK